MKNARAELAALRRVAGQGSGADAVDTDTPEELVVLVSSPEVTADDQAKLQLLNLLIYTDLMMQQLLARGQLAGVATPFVDSVIASHKFLTDNGCEFSRHAKARPVLRFVKGG